MCANSQVGRAVSCGLAVSSDLGNVASGALFTMLQAALVADGSLHAGAFTAFEVMTLVQVTSCKECS